MATNRVDILRQTQTSETDTTKRLAPNGSGGVAWGTGSGSGVAVVIQLTNKSGASVAAGDVVIADTTNDSAFTTTTSAGVTKPVGIAQATIANNATGSVAVQGHVALVNVPSSQTRGQYLATHTVAKQATGAAARVAGSFGYLETGGTTPAAYLFGVPDLGASGGASPLTTKGDVWGYSSVDARIPVGSNAQVLTADSTQTLGLKWATPSASGASGVSQIASIVAASAAIANTETVVVSASIPANTMTAAMSFRITAAGIGTTGLIPGADTFRVRIGTTTLTGNIATSVAPTAVASVTAQPFTFEALVTIRTDGASGTVIGECIAQADNVATGLFTQLQALSTTASTVALDTTATKLIELTFQSGTAGSSCTFEVAAIEQLSANGALLNPMTTKGDVILGDTGGTPTRLGAGTSTYVLTSNGAAAFPSWQAAGGGGGSAATNAAALVTAYTLFR